MLGVASRDDREAMERFVTDTGVDGFIHLADDDGDIWQAFDVASQPAFVFVNDNGDWESHLGAMDYDGIAAQAEALLTR